MVTFNEVPSNNRSPAVFGELDPKGNPGARPHHILVIGTRLSTGTVAALTPTQVVGKTEGDGHHGVGSQLARMLRALKNVNRTSKVTAIGVEEPAAGVAASGTLTITGPATADGELAVYIGGERVAVAVAEDDIADDIATALAAAINADTQLPVTAGAVAGVVTTTCRWKGLTGNDIDLAKLLRDTDKMPAGVDVAIVAMASGAGVPDLAPLVAVLEEEIYDSIPTAFNDDASLDELETEVDRRWRADVALDGHVFAALRGTLSASTTFGDARNSASSTIMGAGASPTPSWIWAAQLAGLEGTISDPGTPRFGLVFPDVLAPAPATRWDHSERNLALFDGISTHRVDSGGRVIIDRLITTWQENALGEADETWLSLPRRRTASFLRMSWVALIAAKYQAYKLASDGTNFGPGVRVVTPSILRGEALAWYQDMERAGHVEDFDNFRAKLVSERHATDMTRLDMAQEPDFVDELVTIATLFAFV